jgi:hypothetical protein
MPALNFANDLVHETITAFGDGREARGNFLQEAVAIAYRQRARTILTGDARG